MNAFKNLYNATLLDLHSFLLNQSKDEDVINLFCKDLLKRTVFFAFYISNLNKESPSSSLMRFQDQSDIISRIFELSHFKDIADIFFPLDSTIIKSLTKIKRNSVNNILLELIRGFSWDLSPKSQTDNETVTPEIFEEIFSKDRIKDINNYGLVYTPYNFAAWMVRSCFQRHLVQKLKITNFDLNDLDSIESDKIELLKKAISQIQVLDISIGSGVFYLAALDFLMEINLRLFKDKSSSMFYLRKIIKNNLYGIDIDENVLIICKIRLLLRILRENPLIQVKDIFEIINDLNIKTGNALVGFTSKPREYASTGCSDLKKLLFRGVEDKTVNSQEIINKYKIFHWFNEFPQVFRMPEITGFDIIIGNPPYIGYRYLGDLTKRILKHLYPKIYTGLNDYYYYFIWRAKQLLAPKGNCALILARYFLEARYAHKLRSQLFKSKCIDILIDFREFKIFPRGINSVILFMRNSFKSTKKIPVYILKNHKISSQSVLQELGTIFESNQLQQPDLQNFVLIKAEIKDNRFLLVSSTLRDLLNRIVDQGVPLDQVCAIGTGYHSGKDSIFSPNIIEEDKGFFVEIKNNNTIIRYPLENHIIKRIVKSSDILPYRIKELKKKYVIFTKRGININDFPLTQQYLQNYKEILKKRYEVRRNLSKWYEIAQIRNPHIYNAKKKIMCPYRSRVPRFAIDKNQRYSSIDCTSLIPKETKFSNIYFILGVLNSELIEIYLIAVAKKLDAQKIELYPNTISKIPLKIPQTKEEEVLYKDITETTKKICQVLESLELKPEHHQFLLKYGKRGFSKMKEDIQELLGLTKSLDMLVYQLYGMEDKIETIKNEISHLFKNI